MTAPVRINADLKPVEGTEYRKVFKTSFGSLTRGLMSGEVSTRYAWSEWYGKRNYMNIGDGYGYYVGQRKPPEDGSVIYQQWSHLNYDSLVVVNDTSESTSQTLITAGAVSILDANGNASLTTKGLTIKGSKGRVRITDVGIEILDASGNVTKTILFSKILTN